MRTAIYVRVSTDRQTQAQTIEQQVERLQRHLIRIPYEDCTFTCWIAVRRYEEPVRERRAEAE